MGCLGPNVLWIYDEASFGYYGPRLWNSLLGNLRAAETESSLKKEMKTHLLVYLSILLKKKLLFFLC